MSKVAIITRTLNRPLLLRRAAKSISNQTFDDYCWVVVNDGEKEAVKKIVTKFPKEKVIVIHNPNPIGMEAASNLGIKESESEYIVIHDDDDTWHPKFLEKTTAYLDNCGPLDIQQGVITHAVVKTEEIIGNSIKFREQEPFNTWMTEVSLYRMLANNTFPPICFLYRRDVHKEIGYYEENLPVLGDWDFNIRFLLKYEIGLIPKVLAYYHQRSGLNSNTVIEGNKTHQFYDNFIRNKYLRQEIHKGTIGIGYYMNAVKATEIIYGLLQDLKTRIENVEAWPNILPSRLKNMLKKLQSR